jgi:hypothetical protein
VSAGGGRGHRGRPPHRHPEKLGYGWSTDAGWSSSVARWAHNPEVAGSNPAPATTTEWPSQSLWGPFRFMHRPLHAPPRRSAVRPGTTPQSPHGPPGASTGPAPTQAGAGRLGSVGSVRSVPRRSTGGRGAPPWAGCRPPGVDLSQIREAESRLGVATQALFAPSIAPAAALFAAFRRGNRAGQRRGGVCGSTRPGPDGHSPCRPAGSATRPRPWRRHLGARPHRP